MDEDGAGVREDEFWLLTLLLEKDGFDFMEVEAGLDSILAMLYSRGSKNWNISSRVDIVFLDAICFVHSSRSQASKSSKASAARN